jgi:hypothetical protein
MAKKSTSNVPSPSKQSFAEIILTIGDQFSVPKAFEDFLTMAITACTQNLQTNQSWYEEEYLHTIAYYKDSDRRFLFPQAFAQLVGEMEERTGSSSGNDVLGEFFEHHLCTMIASLTCGEKMPSHSEQPLRILDPACGSGRMLIATHASAPLRNEYYGIDIDRTCVKMTAINLFLNGMWNSEVMCANSLNPDDFAISYRISLVPLGIFKIEEKEKSLLWNLVQNSFSKTKTPSPAPFGGIVQFPDKSDNNATQLDLF